MIMAGGTGGHIFPALAVAEQLRAQGWTVVWIGVRGGMEERLIPPRGYAMVWVRFSGVRGKGIIAAALLPFNLLVAFWQTARAIVAHRPDVVLGMGGYVSFSRRHDGFPLQPAACDPRAELGGGARQPRAGKDCRSGAHDFPQRFRRGDGGNLDR